jgi:hypothetical protein
MAVLDLVEARRVHAVEVLLQARGTAFPEADDYWTQARTCTAG